jgi:diguanylate cyclase (GGDEF)-like protein
MDQIPVPENEDDEAGFLAEIERLIGAPAHHDNPLHAPLARLFALHRQQNERLLRLIHLSDGYHELGRLRSSTLSERFERHLRRLEKLARISDRYQDQLRSLNEALLHSALKDPLTELGNRRYLMERLHDEDAASTTPPSAYCLAILDVDHFKRINDGWGHDMGDTTLKHIADALRGAIRHSDFAGRWGGEEFLLIFPATELADAFQITERVRQAIGAISIAHRLGPVTVSASIGLTRQLAGEHFATALDRADAALLRAKRDGRDRTVIG